MDTLQEALFRAMLNEGWFTDSSGDVESPTGYFGYMVNQDGDWLEIVRNFQEVLTQYQSTLDDSNKWDLARDFYGVWSAYIDSNGIIHIHKHGDYVRSVDVPLLGIELTQPVRHAMQTFRNRSDEYQEWQGN